jgi:hypothetical protein
MMFICFSVFCRKCIFTIWKQDYDTVLHATWWIRLATGNKTVFCMDKLNAKCCRVDKK